MDISTWTAVITLTKFFTYIGVSAYIGGTFIIMLASYHEKLTVSITRYIRILICIGIVAVIINFFVRVAELSESGVTGLWDYGMMQMLWDSSLRDSLICKIMGFTLGYIGLHLTNQVISNNILGLKLILLLLYLFITSMFAFSFGVVGHTSSLSIEFQFLIAIHVMFVMWWMGSLWPLRASCRDLQWQPLKKLMIKFGHLATAFVAVLIICGVVVFYKLTGSFDEILHQSYGRLFMVKISLVALILLFAAWHKLFLVPSINSDAKSSRILSRSIKYEMCVGLLILLTTAVVTTFFGPDH